MSTIKTKNVQVGTDGTASNNFTIYVPGTPDGTVRIGNGDAGAVTDAVTINSSGAVTLANNLTVTGTVTQTGNATMSNNLTVTGTSTLTGAITSTGGIYLGGTASANLLDDYEYGSWTPNVYHSASNNSTWTQKQGRYVKIGDQVTCWFLCDSGNSGTTGSDLLVGTLPFATGDGNANIPYGTCGIWGANGLSPQDGSVFMLVSSTTLKIYHGGGAITAGTTYISGMFTYRIQP